MSSIANSGVGCSLGITRTNILSYADDIALLAPSAAGLQFLLNKLSVELEELCLVVNPTKSNYMVFTKSRSSFIDTKVFLSESEISRCNECSYLGIMLSDVCSVVLIATELLLPF